MKKLDPLTKKVIKTLFNPSIKTENASRVFLLGLHTRFSAPHMNFKPIPIGIKEIEGVTR